MYRQRSDTIRVTWRFNLKILENKWEALMMTYKNVFFFLSIDRWLVPLPQETGGANKGTKSKKNKSFKQTLKEKLPYQLTAPYMKNNYVLVVFVVFFTIINVGLFISRAIQYRKSNVFVIFARACGKYWWFFTKLNPFWTPPHKNRTMSQF